MRSLALGVSVALHAAALAGIGSVRDPAARVPPVTVTIVRGSRGHGSERATKEHGGSPVESPARTEEPQRPRAARPRAVHAASPQPSVLPEPARVPAPVVPAPSLPPPAALPASEPEASSGAPGGPEGGRGSLGRGTAPGAGAGGPDPSVTGEGGAERGGNDQPEARPRTVAAHLLAQSLLRKVDFEVPPPVLSVHRGQKLRIAVLMCVRASGEVDADRTRIIAGVPGTEDAVMAAVRQWRYRPQALPLCAPVNFEVNVRP